MARLLVNPGTTEAWEIQLQPGLNRIGRSEQNDFPINHPTISGTHCEFVVSDAGVLVKDLGSTRGTYVDGKPVPTEAFLKTGQRLQLGAVEMIFESDAVENPPHAEPEMVATLTQVPVLPPDIPALDEMPAAATPEPLPALLGVGVAYCKNHSRSPARFFCSKCQTYFCAPCIIAHASTVCGIESSPAILTGFNSADARGFFERLPGAFVYPFRGSGLLILVASTLVFAGLAILKGPVLGIVFQILALSYLFSFMQEIVLSTAAEENEMPELPGLDGFLRGLLCLAGTALISFGPALGLALAENKFAVSLPPAILPAAFMLGCIYFPMAFLAATMKNSFTAANPFMVLPAMFKAPLAYLVPVALLAGFFAASQPALGFAGGTKITEPPANDLAAILAGFGMRALWSLAAVYLLTANMRILGLLFVTTKGRLKWFQQQNPSRPQPPDLAN